MRLEQPGAQTEQKEQKPAETSASSYRYRKDVAFDFLVLDEATEIKNEASAAFK